MSVCTFTVKIYTVVVVYVQATRRSDAGYCQSTPEAPAVPTLSDGTFVDNTLNLIKMLK